METNCFVLLVGVVGAAQGLHTLSRCSTLRCGDLEKMPEIGSKQRRLCECPGPAVCVDAHVLDLC